MASRRLAASAAALAAIVAPIGSAAEPPAGPTVVAVDAPTGAIGQVVPVGRDPLILTVAVGRVWVINVADGRCR